MFRAAGLVRSAAGRARASVQRNLNGGDRQIGDYPTNIPFESNQTRDPFKYWDKQTRRDFGEPLHEQDEVLSVWAYDFDDYISKWKALGMLTTAFAGLGLVALAAGATKPDERQPVRPREFPFDNNAAAYGSRPQPSRVALTAVAEES